MRFGYACINLSVPGGFVTCRLNTAKFRGIDYLNYLAVQNFRRVRDILLWNERSGIQLYRLSSDLIPFGSHPFTDGWKWWEDYNIAATAKEIREIAERSNTRITIHPGQYNNLSSDSGSVIRNTLHDLEHQAKMLKLLGGTDMILHVGGKYEGKVPSIARFKSHYSELSDYTKSVLRLENDDKSFDIADVLGICYDMNIKPMFDYHHNICLPSVGIREVWKALPELWGDQRIKIHLSSGKRFREDRSHSDYISNETWKEFYRDFRYWPLDVMIEAKAKDHAALSAKLLFDMGVY